MLTRLLSLFTCRHRNYGRAFTDDQGRMYVVCSACCQRVPYDWERMEIARATVRDAVALIERKVTESA